MDVEKEGSCKILGALGFFVQLSLGFLSFMVLIIKRYFERPKRKWKIWILDASKQLVSALVAHLLNVSLAVILSYEGSNDACIWYFITIMFDTTIGVIICYAILHLIEYGLSKKKGLKNFKSGNYITVIKDSSSNPNVLPPPIDKENNLENQIQEVLDKNLTIKNLNRGATYEIPPNHKIKIDYLAWFIQLLIWNIVVVVSKSLLYFVEAGLSTNLESVGSYIFEGVSKLPALKLVIVMVIIPLVMNSFQFWIQDNFLKKSIFTTKEKKLNQEFYEGLNLFQIGEGNELNCDFGENIHQNKDKIDLMYNKDLNNNQSFEIE